MPVCSQCGESKKRAEFTKNQLKKESSKRKCKTCVRYSLSTKKIMKPFDLVFVMFVQLNPTTNTPTSPNLEAGRVSHTATTASNIKINTAGEAGAPVNVTFIFRQSSLIFFYFNK